MQGFSIDDPGRLAALAGYDILDTPAEVGFDDIVHLAAHICATPVALVSLVATERQWFKARIGFEPCETPLNQSVCAHAIASGGLLVIPDLTMDERTRGNTLVSEPPHIRFYAGALLETPEGQPLGTLCVIDSVPRPEGLTPAQAESLQALARQVMSLLELRRAARAEATARRERDASEERLRLALEASGAVGLWDWMIATGRLHGDANFARLYGLDADKAAAGLTMEAYQVHVVPEDVPGLRAQLRTVFESGGTFLSEYRIAVPGEPLRWVECKGRISLDAAGDPVRFSGTAVDITERKTAEQQKQLLMEELAHRVKNTFAVVQAIASQTLRKADRAVADTFQERLLALGRAHDVLLQTSWSSITMSALMRQVLRLDAEGQRFSLTGPDLIVGSRAALSLSLLMHEMTTNAVKYGALSVDGGRVTVGWSVDGEEFRLDWVESGGPPARKPERAGFGSRLIGMGISGARRAELDYRPTGLSARFSAPLAQVCAA